MNPMQLDLLSAVMSMHDPSKPIPYARLGESVTAYWLRVVQYQAWADGYEEGTSDHPYEANPYGEV